MKITIEIGPSNMTRRVSAAWLSTKAVVTKGSNAMVNTLKGFSVPWKKENPLERPAS